MASDPEEDVDLSSQASSTYSFTECKKIGRELLNELKISVTDAGLYFSDAGHIEEPRAKARDYLAESEVLQLLEDLIAKLVFKRPDKPIDFLVNEIEEMKTARKEATVGDKESSSI